MDVSSTYATGRQAPPPGGYKSRSAGETSFTASTLEERGEAHSSERDLIPV